MDGIDSRDHVQMLEVAHQHVCIHDESVRHFIDTHRREVRSVAAFFVRKNAGVEVAFRQLSGVLFRIGAVGFAPAVHLSKLLKHFVHLRAPSRQFRKFRRQFVRTCAVVEQLVDAVVGFHFGQCRLDLSVEFLQQSFDTISGPCLIAVGVGSNSRTVDAQFRQLGDSHVDRDAKHLPMDVFEFLLVLATKVADGAVVDGAARDQPHEIHGMFDLVFDASRTANAADHGEQQNFAQDAGVDRRLAEFTIVRVFPCGPVESVENLIEQPDGTLVGNSFFEADWYEEYLISRPWRRLPGASIDRFLRHLPAPVISGRFRGDRLTGV